MLSSIVFLALASPAQATETTFQPDVFIHLRPEVRVNPRFVANADDTQMAVQQGVRAGLKATRGNLTAHVQLQDVRAWGTRATSVSTEPNAFAHQGYLEVDTGKGWLRVGRQELHMLNGYYLSRAPWNLAGRSFDGARFQHNTDSLTIDAFGMMLSPPFPASPATSPDELGVPSSSLGDDLGGVFVTWKANKIVEPTVFVLGRYGGATYDDPTREKRWLAPAARVLVKHEKTLVDANAMLQIGREKDTPRRAHSIIVRLEQGSTAPLGPGVALVFDQTSGHACDGPASGGDCTSDVLNDFDLQFGRNHALRGAIDQVMGNNARQIALEGFVDPAPGFRASVLTSLFQLTNPEGAWRRNGGALQGAGWIPGNTDPNLGIEVDAIATWSHNKVIDIDGGWSMFQPIGAGAAMTGDAAQHYVFARNRFTF